MNKINENIYNKRDKDGDINPNDEFYTPLYAIDPLVKYLKKGSRIWLPFDTKDSNYYKLFTSLDFECLNTHIFNGKDFFDYKAPLDVDYIISNPPYSIKYEVFKRLFEFNIPFAMLVGVVGLFESQKRFNLFKDNTFEIMYFNKRISYFQDYSHQNTSLNPPFSSVYLCSNILPTQIVFEVLDKSNHNQIKLF